MYDSEEKVRERFNRKQFLIAVMIVILLTIFGSYLGQEKAILPIQLFSGVLLGAALTRTRFGYAGGIKRIYVRGEGSLSKALLIMLLATMIIFMGVQWHAAQNGAVAAFNAVEGDSIIPGTQNVHMANMATIIGGILFGIGMIFAGGCASGTLTDMGEGEGRALFVFIFFVLGSAPGELARYVFDESSLGNVGVRAYLPDYFGYFGALLVSVLLLGFVLWLILSYEKKRKLEGSYMDPKGDWEDLEKPILDVEASETSLFSYKTYHKLFVERWTFNTGALVISIICSFILLATGKAWGVTSAFTKLEVAILKPLGVGFTSPAFTEIVEDVNAGLLLDGGTIRNLGIVLGAVLAFLLAGRFKFGFKLNKKDIPYFVIGGLLMGFGARFAKGCNAGAMYSAISTFSISGWVFTVAMVIGGLISLKLFAGKMSLIPAKRKK